MGVVRRYRRGTEGTVAAAGAAQATAGVLTNETNVVTGADGAKGVILLADLCVPGGPSITVINSDAAQTLLIYPQVGGAINAAGTNNPVSLLAGGVAVFYPSSDTQWYATVSTSTATVTDMTVATLTFSGGTGVPEIHITTNLADALSIETGVGDVLTIDTSTSKLRTGLTGALTVTPTWTLASGASATYKGVSVPATTLTLTGTTQVTTSTGLNLVEVAAPTYTDTMAVVVDLAATVYIGGPPTAGGMVTLTDAMALWIDSGFARLDGGLSVGGAVPTNPQALFIVQAQTKTATANQSYFHGSIIATGGPVTIPAGTAPVVASLNLQEPNITATGTVTAASTLYIKDAPTEGSANYALWVDAGNARFDGDIDMAATASDVVIKANTAAALEIYDSTTKIWAADTRNTLKNVSTITLTGVPVTVASETAAHINATLNIAAKTITYTGATGTTSSLGSMLYLGVPTFTDSSMMTLVTASALHINAVAAAGGMLTITNSYMVSTSVSGCFLTNAGVWTDMACFADGKLGIADASGAQIDAVLAKLSPRTWEYDRAKHGNDRGRKRVGIVYDDLPEELRAPGQESAVSTGLLSSFALAAIKTLRDRIAKLEKKAAA